MTLRLLCIAILSLLMLQCSTQKMQVTRINYTDQNNNRFSITSEMIQYKPISAAESSSGYYDGGEPKTVLISADSFKELLQLALQIKDDTTLHSKQRQMMTSLIGFTTSEQQKEMLKQGAEQWYVLKPSKIRTSFEQQLLLLVD